MGDYTLYIWVGVMILLFYFMIIRPQKKKERQERQMRNSLEPGDVIITIGGFTGKILTVKDDTVTFETGPDRIKLTISKYAIQTKEMSADEAKKAKKEEKKAKKAELAEKTEENTETKESK